jgi:hypothetical protein
MRKPGRDRPWPRRARRVSAVTAGFGAAALGGFVVGLFQRRDPTRYLSSEPPPEPADASESVSEWLT